MPDQIAQHVSWDATKMFVYGVMALFVMTIGGVVGLVTSNRREIEFIKTNYPTREEVNNDMMACQADLISRMDKSEKNLTRHINASADSVKELMYVAIPECKPK